jgi:hypothetical protein
VPLVVTTADTNSTATVPRPRKHASCVTCVRPPGTALLRAYPVASELFLNEILQRIIFVREFRIHLFVLRQLGLRFFQASQIRCAHATVLRLPVVVGRIADAVFATQIFDLRTGIRFFESDADPP